MITGGRGWGVLTVADVLEMPAVRAGDPLVLAGAGQLERAVRWVHPTELADIGPLLRGGDLVLTTGIALPDSAPALAGFARSLVDSDAAGLLVELGRRWSDLPASLVQDCERLGLPLIALRREVRFAAVTQAVGERLVDEQLTELREAQRVHDTFTELGIAEAGPDQILDAVQRLSGSAVVLESEQHRILDHRSGPEAPGPFLDDWERRSRRVPDSGFTGWDASNGWLVTRVGRPERAWGRLVIGSATAPSQRLTAVAERAAAALAMHRLHNRTRDGQARRLHQEVLLSLLSPVADPGVGRRAELAGLPAENRQYVGLVLRPAAVTGPAAGALLASQLDELVAAGLRAAELVRASALVAAFESDVRVLLALSLRVDPVRGSERFVEQVRSRIPVVAGAGSAVRSLPTSARSLREALQVMAALPEQPGTSVVHRLEDVHVRGLLTLLADDERLTAFAERELAPLREADLDLLHTTRVLIECWGSKSAAADRLSISRPVLYDRIGRIERLLGASLEDAEVRTSLHLALLHERPARE